MRQLVGINRAPTLFDVACEVLLCVAVFVATMRCDYAKFYYALLLVVIARCDDALPRLRAEQGQRTRPRLRPPSARMRPSGRRTRPSSTRSPLVQPRARAATIAIMSITVTVVTIIFTANFPHHNHCHHYRYNHFHHPFTKRYDSMHGAVFGAHPMVPFPCPCLLL